MTFTKRIGIFILLVFTLMGCSDYLTQAPKNRLTQKALFTKKNNVLNMLANVYSKIPHYSNNGQHGDGTAASDEVESSFENFTASKVNLGLFNPSSGWIRTKWSDWYREIRNATYFMKHVDACKECGTELVKRYKAQARAVRALYYFYLFRNFGPPIIIKKGSLSPDASFEQLQIPRATVDETVNYIINQFDSAAVNLPSVPSVVGLPYYGRMTKSFLLAMKSIVLLWAASPLYNGNTDYAAFKNPDGTQLVDQTYNKNKWKKAADAAKKFIDTYVPDPYHLFREKDNSGQFSPYLSLRDVVLKPWNSGIIYARPNSTVDQIQMIPGNVGAPDGYRGRGSMAITQTMVDAFFMDNGYPIDNPKSGYKKSGFSMFQAPYDTEKRKTYNEWVNRGARFYVDVTYNGSLWLRTDPVKVITTTWFGGNSGRGAVGGRFYPRTGYILRKGKAVGTGTKGNKTIPMLRLAEIYLDYVEALNEYDPGNPDILKYLNKIRNRAGLPGYGDRPNQIPAPKGQAAMRKAIHHERRVELAFEWKRYFDVRRWKIAGKTEGGPFYGLNVLAKNLSNFYNKVIFEKRVFTKKDYLLPLPQHEVNIDKKLVQNPGW